MQGEEEIDQLELQLHRLVPEHLHPEDRPERPEEREKQKFLFRRPPFPFRGLPFVEGEGKEGDDVEEDVDCGKDEDVLHLDIFGLGRDMGFGFFCRIWRQGRSKWKSRLKFKGSFFFAKNILRLLLSYFFQIKSRY